MPKNRRDWLTAGLKTLATAGVDGLTIEKLTAELGVTKGSFYHHFQNADDFKQQTIAFWADQYLDNPIQPPGGPDELLALLDTIMAEAFAAVTEPEMTIRVWAQQDDMVRSFVERVDAVRQAFVFEVFRAVTGDKTAARIMTDILSTMLIGSMMVLPRIPPERVVELYREFKRLYGLPLGAQ